MKRLSRWLIAAALYLQVAVATAQAPAVALTGQKIETRLVEDGRPVALELVVARPAGDGPFPVLVFNHGSVSNGNDPREVRHTVTYPDLAAFFVERGWLVVFPQRRGRGQSDGRYAEGWDTQAGRYACEPAASLAGLAHAMEDLGEVMALVRQRPEVNPSRVLLGGHSKGGILAMAFAAAQPNGIAGVLNFVGGWVGERCGTADQINTSTLAQAAAFPGPTLWLYGERDPFYSLAHTRKNFDAFTAAGGRGQFHALTFGPLRNDHQLVRTRAVWAEPVARFLAGL